MYWLRKQEIHPQKMFTYDYLFLLVVLGDLLFLGFYSCSLVFTSATKVNIFINFAPVIVLLLAIILWRNRLSYLKTPKHILQIIGVFILGVIGSFALILDGITKGEFSGDFLSLGTMIADVIFVMALIEHARKHREKDSLTFVSYRYFYETMIAMFCIGVFIPLGYAKFKNILMITGSQYFWLFLFGLLESLGIYLSYEAFKRIDGVIAYLTFNLLVVFTFLVEICMGKFFITWYFILGSIIVVVASILGELILSKCEELAH